MDLASPLPFRHQREAHMPKRLEIPPTALHPSGRDNMDSAQDVSPSSHSHSSPTSTPPPRSPLPPHKLASIANALGVNTPMPAFFRSPSPSGSSSFRAPSRYLLHVVPPVFLPSDEDDDGSDPDGASTVSASSYRSQFRRGTLIPLYPTLHSQLGAIAREYNLPSTGGLILYLVQSSQDGAQDGPRITEDVWKLLWHKALQAERQDSQPRSVSALNLRSDRLTPSAPPSNKANRDVYQPLSSNPRNIPYPSPSTSSTPSSEIHLSFSGKTNASTSDLDTLASEYTPNSLLPILGKVEFDIDRRKAGWFNSWMHGKRERSRWRSTSDGNKLALELPERADSRSRLQPRLRADSSPPSESSEYMVLDDFEAERTAVDDDEDLADQATIVLHNRDPLADVFGNDAATWDELHAGRNGKPTGLGITSSHAELVIPPGTDNLQSKDVKVRDEDEVIKLWDENKRPKLSLQPPDSRASPRKGAPPPLNIQSTPETKGRLPPGVKLDSFLPYLDGRSMSDSSSSTSEQFDEKRSKRRTGMVFGDLQVKIVAEPEEMTRQELARSSQIVMKHKLDELEKQLAQLSPRQLNERNRAQVSRERTQEFPLRSAPPGVDKFNLSPPKHVKGARSFNSPSRHPPTPITSTPVEREAEDSILRTPPRKDSLNVTHQPRPPRSQEHKRGQSSQSSSGSSLKSHHEHVWPSSAPSSHPHMPPSPSSPPSRPSARLQERAPPQLTLKRASTGQHKGDVSEETRARALDDDRDTRPPLRSALTTDLNSPVLPLSPDPFGKRPVEDLRTTRVSNDSVGSTESRPPSRLQGTALPSSVPENAEVETQSSRFSADSEQGFEQLSKQRRSRSNSVMSVRGFRNLWRKSTASNKGIDIPPPIPSEPSPSLPSYATSQHSRGESSVSQRSVRSATDRMRRPSAALRPESDTDPFQFDNANIYKSSSSSSLASATPGGANRASATGSIGKSKGILKGWSGNANPSDVEARRMRRPSLERTMSPASASPSDSGERSADSQHSSPPSSPPNARRASVLRNKQLPSVDLTLSSHSLPTGSVLGLSKYSEAPLAKFSSRPSFDEGSISQISEFEILAAPRRSTPSSSYTGEIS